MGFAALALMCVPVSPVVSSSSCTSTAPIAYWKFDEIGAFLAPDSSGNGYDGVEYNESPSLSTDITDTGLANIHSFFFDAGNGEAIQVSRPVQDDFTLCAWFKTTAVGIADAHWVTLPLFHSETGFIDNDFGFGLDSNGYLMFGNGDVEVADYMYSSDTLVNTGDWTHGCVTRVKSTGQIKLYVNGAEDGGGIGSTKTLDSNPVMQIGYGTDGAPFWDGYIDEARVYNSALSAEEIAALANGHFACTEVISTATVAQPSGGRRGKTGNSNILKALQSRSLPRSLTSSGQAEHASPPSSRSAASNLQARTCERVDKWMTRSSVVRDRINERLQKRFGFRCAE